MKFGRRRPTYGPMFRLKNYLLRGVPAPPRSITYTPKASLALSQMYGNDTVGDCTCAGVGHIEGVLTANAGDEFIYTPAEMIAFYSAVSGYIPGDEATDNGADEVTVLNRWLNKGFPPGQHHPAGWLWLDATEPMEYRLALYWFENLYFGLELPAAWVTPFPSSNGFVWDVAGAPDPDNGHAVMGCSYSPYGPPKNGVGICSWGLLGLMTDRAIAEYCVPSAGGALYTIVSQDAINKLSQQAPNGFNLQQLLADFKSMGGRVV